jgi:hypothetical protein
VTRALRFNNDTTTPVRLDVSVGRTMIIVSGEILRGCRREWNYQTPIQETMEALHDVVRAGKARYIGASFEYRLHPVGSVLAGFLFYPIAKGTEVFHFYREYLPQLPDACRVDIAVLAAPMATSWLAFFLATSGRWPKASVWSSHCAA